MNIDLPFLRRNTANSCPADIKDFAEYLSFELGTKVAQKRIHFVRTAKIHRAKYWLFRAKPLHGDESWAFVHTLRVFLIIPTYCSSCWGEPDWSEEEVLLKYHWQQNMNRHLDDFDPLQIPGFQPKQAENPTSMA